MDKPNLIGEKVLALSWKEPYGSLMLPPFNKIETRVWSTTYRGWVLICTSKVPYKEHQIIGISGELQTQRIFTTLLEAGSIELNASAIGIGRLVDCRQMEKRDEDRCFVRYHPDLFCHVYDQVHAIHPLPWKGKQGWSVVSDEFLRQITFL